MTSYKKIRTKNRPQRSGTGIGHLLRNLHQDSKKLQRLQKQIQGKKQKESSSSFSFGLEASSGEPIVKVPNAVKRWFGKGNVTPKEVALMLEGYDKLSLTIGVLGGHSALDVLRGAKKLGFKTLAVCQKGRDAPYSKYYKSRDGKGVVDEVIIVDKFADIVKESVQDELRKRNTIFIHNRYFWVYCNFQDIESKFKVPIYGTRDMLKLEERDIPKNQYYLLEKAGIRTPKIYKSSKEIDRLVIVKVAEAKRGYERAFFLCNSEEDFKKKSEELITKKIINREDLKKAVIEEYVVGAQVNLNFFYSPLTGELELMGTDMRRQTNVDGLLRLPATEQMQVLQYMKPKFIETGHVAVTVKESLLSKIFDLGEKFVAATQKEHGIGIIGPFALQGAVIAEEGKEDIAIFDVSLRIPGSPGTMFTPYSAYLQMDPLSYGERIAMEIKKAQELGQLDRILT